MSGRPAVRSQRIAPFPPQCRYRYELPCALNVLCDLHRNWLQFPIMNVYKWADQNYLMQNYRELFAPNSELLPRNFPRTREINIQISKWERMLDDHCVLYVKVPTKKARRVKLPILTSKQLRQDARLTSQTMGQGKRVHTLALELLRHYLKEQLATRGVAHSRQDFARFRRMFEAELLKCRRNFFKNASRQWSIEAFENKSLPELTAGGSSLN